MLLYNTFFTYLLGCIKNIIYCAFIVLPDCINNIIYCPYKMPFSTLFVILWIFKKVKHVASWSLTKGALYILGNEYSVTALEMKLNEKEEEIKSLTIKLNEMTQRLAEGISNSLSADESTFENICIQARPMKIAEEYSLLFSNTWLDAKIALDDIVSLEYHKSDQQSPQKEVSDMDAASVENNADEYNDSKRKTTLEQRHSTYTNTKDECLDERPGVTGVQCKSNLSSLHLPGNNTVMSDNYTENDNMEVDESLLLMDQDGDTETIGCDASATSEEKATMENKPKILQETRDYKSAKATTTGAVVTDLNGHCDNQIYVPGNNDEDLEQWIHKFLLKIISTSWTKASELYQQKMKQLLFAAKNPANSMNYLEDEEDEMPNTQTTTLISDLMRYNAEKANLENLEKSVVAECSEWPHYDKCVNDEKVRDYLQECTRIACKMVIQRPPMMLVCDQVGKSWSQCEGLEPIWNSQPNNPGATVKYYKSPQLNHGNSCMVKGSVYVA